MLTKRLGKVFEESGCENRQTFAESIKMPIDRLRNLLKGNVKTIKPAEAQAIENLYGYSAQWLRDGTGPLRVRQLSAQAAGHASTATLMQLTSAALIQVNQIPDLTQQVRTDATAVLKAVAARDGKTLNQLLTPCATDADSLLHRLYRQCDAADQQVLMYLAQRLAAKSV